MPFIAAIVMSVVFLFSLTGLPYLQNRWKGQGSSDPRWSASAKAGDPYRPARKGVVTDWDGYAHRGADNSQMTRRDRGREFWEPTATNQPGSNPKTLRSLIARQLNLPEPAQVFSNAPSVSNPKVNFTHRHAAPQLQIEAPAGEIRQTVNTPIIPSGSVPTAPVVLAPISKPPIVVEEMQPLAPARSLAPEPLIYQAVVPVVHTPVTAPLYQNQIETMPLPAPPKPAIAQVAPKPALSLGRRIQQSIQADPAISRVFKLTIRVVYMRGRITLRGVVPNEKDKQRIQETAREIAGQGVSIDNRLLALSS